jgi:hypothetical protein
MGSGQRAITVTQYVRLSDSIADARIMYVSGGAAEVYGVERPELLVGKYLSQTMQPEDMLRGSLYSLARSKGISVPTRYDTRIIRPDGEEVFVVKDTVQMVNYGVLVWVTILTPTREPELQPPPSPESLGLGLDEIVSYRGTMNVSDLERLIKAQGPPHVLLTSDVIHHNIDALHQANQSLSVEALPMPAIAEAKDIQIRRGATLRLPGGRYLHRCAPCGESWISPNANPQRCPRMREDKRGPRCGSIHWRDVTTGGGQRIRGSSHDAQDSEVEDIASDAR